MASAQSAGPSQPGKHEYLGAPGLDFETWETSKTDGMDWARLPLGEKIMSRRLTFALAVSLPLCVLLLLAGNLCGQAAASSAREQQLARPAKQSVPMGPVVRSPVAASVPATSVGARLTFVPGLVLGEIGACCSNPIPNSPVPVDSTDLGWSPVLISYPYFVGGFPYLVGGFGFALDQSGNLYYASDLGVIGAIPSSTESRLPGVTNPDPSMAYWIAGLKLASDGVGTGGIYAGLHYVKTDSQDNIYFSDSDPNNYYQSTSLNSILEINAQTGVVTTYAGSSAGTAGYTGDGGLASSATLNEPWGFFIDAANNMFIADNGNAVVRRVDGQTGIITTVAGGGQSLADDIPAASASINPNDVYVDKSGNLYIMDGTDNVLRVVYNSGTIPGLAAGNLTAGNIYTVAGTYGVQCSASALLPCGDGGSAQQALFYHPYSITGDAAGDIYIADTYDYVYREINTSGTINTIIGSPTGVNCFTNGYNCNYAIGIPSSQESIGTAWGIALAPDGTLYAGDAGPNISPSDGGIWQISTAASAVDLGDTQLLGTTSTQLFTVSNTGDQPLDFAGITISDPSFVQQLTGTNDCTSTQILASGASCNFQVVFTPVAAQAYAATASFADNSTNATSGQNVISLSGTGVTAGGTKTQNIAFAPLANVTYGSLPVTLNATSDSGLPVTFFRVSGPAQLVGSQLAITGAGTVNVTAYQFGDTNYAPAAPVTHSFTVAPVPLTVTANSLSRQYGQPNPMLTYSSNGFVNGDSQTSLSGSPLLSTAATQTSSVGTYPISITQGTLVSPNYAFAFVNGILTIAGGVSQGITFPSLSNVTYGVAPFTLPATADSNLPITYTVTGPATVSGSTLTVTGAGSVTVTAHQDGNADYAGATPVSQSFTVAQAPLNVTATNTSRPYDTANVLTYSITGFVNGDTKAVVSGVPTLSTTATLTSPPGTYPISITLNTLLATNYNFILTGGTLTVTTNSQTITLPQLSAVYGASPFLVGGTTTSGLPITYSVTGPAKVSGSILTITGVGTVEVTANQTGNSDYLAAPTVTTSFTVTPATLTATAMNASRQYGAANPPLTYSISGFVNGDTQSVVSGAPTLSTTATTTSPTGTYPIGITPGSLAAPSYRFAVVNGTLTVTADTQTITFPTLSNTIYGTAPIPLAATSTAGLPVSYTVTGPAALSGSTLTITGAGLVIVAANQAGNAQYAAAATVTQSFTSAPAVLTVTAANATRSVGAANPTFTDSISGFVDGDTPSVVSGAPSLTTTAAASSPDGTYPIDASYGTLSAANYTFTFVNGTLTVTGGAFSLGAMSGGSASATVIPGQSANYNLQLTGNGFTGTVSLACSGAPAQATCTVSPSSVTLTDTTQSSPYTVTVTTAEGAASAQLKGVPARNSRPGSGLPVGVPVSLGVLGMLGLAGIRRNWRARFLACTVVLVLASALSACGGSSSSSISGTQPGSYTLTVTATSGTTSQTQPLSLVIQ